jgi:hypothetical protein
MEGTRGDEPIKEKKRGDLDGLRDGRLAGNEQTKQGTWNKRRDGTDGRERGTRIRKRTKEGTE